MDRKKARGHTHTHTHTRPLIILSLSFHSKAASQTDNSFEMYSSAEEKWFHYVSFIALPDLSLCPWRIASRYWTVIGSKPKRESNKKTKKQPCFVGHFCWQQLCRPFPTCAPAKCGPRDKLNAALLTLRKATTGGSFIPFHQSAIGGSWFYSVIWFSAG